MSETPSQTAWQLREQLAARWTTNGITTPSGERLQLVALEAMPPTWEVNDAHGHWGSRALMPSLEGSQYPEDDDPDGRIDLAS
jgi:hypothetical protein